jgi:hypothetical protein
MATPDAQCLRDMSFIYGFYPYRGNWSGAWTGGRAELFLTDTPVWRTGIHNGALPPSKQFFSLADGGKAVSLSCLKRSEDGRASVIRLYNTSGAAARVKLQSAFFVKSAEITTPDEKKQDVLNVESGRAVRIDIAAKKIVTLKLVLEPENILRCREDIDAGPVSEQEEEADFSACESEPVVTWEDVEREERRAASLEYSRGEKFEALRSVEQAGPREKNEAILLAETVRRESLEARLSAMMLRKKYFLLSCADDAELRRELLDYERKARELGIELNRARIAKRAREYILDYYKSCGS